MPNLELTFRHLAAFRELDEGEGPGEHLVWIERGQAMPALEPHMLDRERQRGGILTGHRFSARTPDSANKHAWALESLEQQPYRLNQLARPLPSRNKQAARRQRSTTSLHPLAVGLRCHADSGACRFELFVREIQKHLRGAVAALRHQGPTIAPAGRDRPPEPH